MKRQLLSGLPRAGGIAMSIALSSVTCAKATTIDFNYTGSVVYYTVPTTGIYDVAAYGAQGGVNTGVVTNSGGLGAEAGGAFRLTAGERLAIVVGGQGGNGSGLDGGGGGGGGSFVALSGVAANYQTGGCSGLHTDACSDTLLAAGGGGGGAGTLWSGIGGQTGNDGADAHLTGGGGALLGGGGGAGLDGGGGGGGYINDGLGGDPNNGCSGGNGCGGKSFETGAAQYDPSAGTGGSAGGSGGSDYFLGFFISGGGAGGFGGGGGAGGAGAGGGGGGYSGGGGGDQGSAGGGGGSYLDSALLLSDQTLVGNAENGNGLVTLSFASPPAVPELSTWAMFVIGFAGVGYAGSRRRVRDRISSAFN